MSLTTRHTSILIGLSAQLSTGDPVLMSEQPALNSGSWDTLVQIYTVRRATLTAENVETLFPAGARLGTRTWWIVGAAPTERAPGFWTIQVTYKGAAGPKPPLVVVGASAASQSATNVDLDGTTIAKLETHQNAPTISVTYWTDDVTATSPGTGISYEMTQFVGTAISPPVSIPVPDNIWDTLAEPVTHFPSGWVLMSSVENRIPGSIAGEITDTYQYFQTYTPG